jgi:hypothetical protein
LQLVNIVLAGNGSRLDGADWGAANVYKLFRDDYSKTFFDNGDISGATAPEMSRQGQADPYWTLGVDVNIGSRQSIALSIPAKSRDEERS